MQVKLLVLVGLIPALLGAVAMLVGAKVRRGGAAIAGGLVGVAIAAAYVGDGNAIQLPVKSAFGWTPWVALGAGIVGSIASLKNVPAAVRIVLSLLAVLLVNRAGLTLAVRDASSSFVASLLVAGAGVVTLAMWNQLRMGAEKTPRVIVGVALLALASAGALVFSGTMKLGVVSLGMCGAVGGCAALSMLRPRWARAGSLLAAPSMVLALLWGLGVTLSELPIGSALLLAASGTSIGLAGVRKPGGVKGWRGWLLTLGPGAVLAAAAIGVALAYHPPGGGGEANPYG
ncbi:MAG: hypothetical protein RBS39_08835 [Phycisphaerales bacterium]|jgi:hypothetical protein|nr:hypothetical protein [Phycisphaerales bacterium]